MPEDLRGDLICLSVKDHYVSVSTTAGMHDLLMRLSDAIAEVDPVEGMQVHRSHWVAMGQVTGGRRTADQAVLQMSNGTQIPVSRANLKAVEAAGLFALPVAGDQPGKGRQATKAGAADIGQSVL
ncbi:MAG: LytTR family DNA-binding domain-containing protein [Paracoccaceae bacterium]